MIQVSTMLITDLKNDLLDNDIFNIIQITDGLLWEAVMREEKVMIYSDGLFIYTVDHYFIYKSTTSHYITPKLDLSSLICSSVTFHKNSNSARSSGCRSGYIRKAMLTLCCFLWQSHSCKSRWSVWQRFNVSKRRSSPSFYLNRDWDRSTNKGADLRRWRTSDDLLYTWMYCLSSAI